ncbi:sensor histidine kinase [Fluviicola sp.]|uniref:tetratricopeptide repeat-containing sensor histidine kinase n=1 Tax=Fluviicola sp. TaxID=1917219 RepID=UPI0031E09D44
MMKQTLLLAFLLNLLSLNGFSQCDTNKINLENDRILELCYEKPKEALKACEKVIVQSQECAFYPGEVRALIRMGICYDVLSKPDQAISYYQKARTVAQKNNYLKGIASCENNLGLIYWRLNDLKRAIHSFHEAKLAFEKMEDNLNVATVMNNLGLIYEELDQEKMALYWYRRSVSNYRKEKNADQVLDVYSNMGNIWTYMGSYDSCIYYSELAIKGYRKTKNKYGLSISLSNLATALGDKKEYDKAESAFRESAAIAKELGNEYSYVSTLINWSNCYRKQKRFAEQEKLLQEALPIAEKLNAPEQLYKISEALGFVALRKGDSKAAGKYWAMFMKYNSRYTKELQDKTISKTNALYEIKSEKQQTELYRKKKDIELKEQQIARRSENIFWIALVSVLFLAILSIIFYFRKRNLQKELVSQQLVFQATNEERKRISYDLHDLVGSQLSFVVNNLELLSFGDKANERINKTFLMSQEAMSSLRDTVWALHSESMSSKVLVDRMKNVAKKWLEDNSIQVKFTAQLPDSDSGAIGLDPGVSLHVMRIFQEGISNIYKHANTRKVEINLKEEGEYFVLSVEDFGIGFDPAIKPEFHYGLKSIEQRAEKIGAVYSIRKSETHSGMVLTLRWKKNSTIA